MEMEPANLLALCDEARQMAKNIAKRSAKGQLTLSATEAQAQPVKALRCHALLKEGCPATHAWVIYAQCTLIWYWPAQFCHGHLLFLTPLYFNHSHVTWTSQISVILVLHGPYKFWHHHLLLFLLLLPSHVHTWFNYCMLEHLSLALPRSTIYHWSYNIIFWAFL